MLESWEDGGTGIQFLQNASSLFFNGKRRIHLHICRGTINKKEALSSYQPWSRPRPCPPNFSPGCETHLSYPPPPPPAPDIIELSRRRRYQRHYWVVKKKDRAGSVHIQMSLFVVPTEASTWKRRLVSLVPKDYFWNTRYDGGVLTWPPWDLDYLVCLQRRTTFNFYEKRRQWIPEDHANYDIMIFTDEANPDEEFRVTTRKMSHMCRDVVKSKGCTSFSQTKKNLSKKAALSISRSLPHKIEISPPANLALITSRGYGYKSCWQEGVHFKNAKHKNIINIHGQAKRQGVWRQSGEADWYVTWSRDIKNAGGEEFDSCNKDTGVSMLRTGNV